LLLAYAELMPRPPRIQLDDVPLHLVQRGHNRAACFFDDEDREYYLHWLGVALEEHECALHAYVLMTNHVHLLLTPSRCDGVAQLFMSIRRRYVRFINQKYDRTGTLWGGRYRSSLVQLEDYLLYCYRYIELNPVRAHIVEAPEAYRWSSFHANALGERNPLITPHTLFTGLGKGDSERRAAYGAMFGQHLSDDLLNAIRNALNHNKPVGNSEFIHKVEELTSLQCQINPPGRPCLKK
jgi:putative transposase